MGTFQNQDSPQTLAEGIAEYFAISPGLTRGPQLSDEAKEFFYCHDTAHVMFGCSTSLDDELIVKIASVLGTSAGFGALNGYRMHESFEIYRELRGKDIWATLLHSILLVPRTAARCLKQRARWPWVEHRQYLATPLSEIRREFGIIVAHVAPTRNEA